MPIASVKPDGRMSIGPSSFDAVPTSQERLKDAYFGVLMEKQRRDPSHQEEEEEEEDSEDSDNPAAGTWYYKEEPVAQNDKAWEKPFAHEASSSVDQESQKNTEATWDHYLHISPETSHFLGAVFFMVRKIYGKPLGDPMEDLNVNLAIWRMFMDTTLRAAVHLGKDSDTNLRFVKNYLWKSTGQLFRETEKLISGQTEITGISLINFQDLRWYRHVYCTVELINMPLPKSMFSPTLRSAWGKWVTILLNPGRRKFNGLRTTIISAN